VSVSPNENPGGEESSVVDVFLSYAHEDHDVAGRLVHLFGCEEWSCWWDRPNIPMGEDFRPILSEAIDQASVVLVLWSSAARRSSWVAWEVMRAKETNKLLEFVIGEKEKPSGAKDRDSLIGRIRSFLTKAGADEWITTCRADGLLEIPRHPHFGQIRDEVLRRVAEAGSLARRCDRWNSRLHVVGFRNRPPTHPIIGWEWIRPGTEDARLVRRERWTQGSSVIYGTTIGNAWQFGVEESVVPLGFVLITEAEHHVQLPRARCFSKRFSFVTPFNVNVRITEGMAGMAYPEGGVDLGSCPKELDERRNALTLNRTSPRSAVPSASDQDNCLE
jgi:hypothetical protein